jgi:acyl-CoA synthetase (AMP-forming)/AMP-acid ligase II
VLLHEIVELAASTCPDREALIADGRRLTFSQLDARVRDMSTRLEELTSPGDRVVMVSDNSLDAVVALYAVPRRGAALASANTRHTPEEIASLVATTAPTVLLASPEQLDRLGPVLEAVDKPPRILSIDGAHPAAESDLSATLDHEGAHGRRQDHDGGHHVAADPRVCAWIIHTSGTTGPPKGAMLTHTNLVAAVSNTAVARPLASDDVYLFPFPLFHVAAYNVLHAHLRRRPVVLVPKFDAARVIAAVRDEGVTSCSLAPTMISMLLDHPDRTPTALRTLRQISYGASPMPLSLLRRVLDELPEVGLAQGYGMTELSGNAVFLGPEDHRRAARDAPHLLDAAGRPGPMVALRVEDDDGNEVPCGMPGEILVRGDQVVAGYWQDPVGSASCRSGPWLRTGDIGRIDADGYLHVIDRRKDIIITGGENVASREVEDVVCTHPSVSQVAVVAVPDERWGEAVCAVVVTVPGADLDPRELIEWTRGRLAGFKRPRRVVTLPEMPVNASGKVDKRRVRELVGSIDLRVGSADAPLSAGRGL